ncbi:MAG: ABC transporter substrate-binding protein, partial [Clostridiales bacterium]|nr:ABC transporter substrate-binding protein [Clostridiales bacterium]
DDGLEYTFDLRKGVKFHDGTDFDAEDVEFTVDMLKNNGSYASFFNELISKVEILDPHKVKIVLNRIEPQFLKRISSYNGSILNKKAVLEQGEDDTESQMQWLASNTAGTGPYKLESLTTDEAHLVVNEDYWGDKPKIDKVILKTVAESSNLRIMLEKGDIDFYRLPAAKDYEALEQNPDIELLVRPANSKIVYLGLNTENKPLDNPKVRQAIAYAVPYEQICKVLGGGEKYAPRARTVLTEELSGSAPVFQYEYDLENAKELLKEAGYENGFKLNFDLFNAGKFPDMAVVLQAELKKIGIDMEINSMAPPAFFQSGDAGKLNFFVVSWWDNAADPVGLLNDIVHSASIPSPGNYAKYVNKDVDSLIDKAKVELEPAKRDELLKDAQEILAEDVPYIPIHEAMITLAFRKNVKNYVHYSDSITRLYELEKE